MVNANPNGKNIWIAASDGDLERVKVCEAIRMLVLYTDFCYT